MLVYQRVKVFLPSQWDTSNQTAISMGSMGSSLTNRLRWPSESGVFSPSAELIFWSQWLFNISVAKISTEVSFKIRSGLWCWSIPFLAGWSPICSDLLVNSVNPVDESHVATTATAQTLLILLGPQSDDFLDPLQLQGFSISINSIPITFFFLVFYFYNLESVHKARHR